MFENPSAPTDHEDKSPSATGDYAHSSGETITVHIAESPSVPGDSSDEISSQTMEFAPFMPGNEAAITHGATSARRVNPLAQAIANELMSQHPRLSEPDNCEALMTYARLVAQIELLDQFLDENGLIDDNGRVRGAAHYKSRLEPVRWRALDALGMTPSSAARLARDTAAKQKDQVDIAQVIARMQAKEQAAHGDSL